MHNKFSLFIITSTVLHAALLLAWPAQRQINVTPESGRAVATPIQVRLTSPGAPSRETHSELRAADKTVRGKSAPILTKHHPHQAGATQPLLQVTRKSGQAPSPLPHDAHKAPPPSGRDTDSTKSAATHLAATSPAPVIHPQPAGAEQPANHYKLTAQPPANGSGKPQDAAALTRHLHHAFSEYFHYPRLAQRNGWQGMVKLGIRIEPNGRLSHIRILQTSGFMVLDQAALDAIHQISVLPGVDDWLGGAHFDTVLPVHYKLLNG